MLPNQNPSSDLIQLYVSKNDDLMKMFKEQTEQIAKLYQTQKELVDMLKGAEVIGVDIPHLQVTPRSLNLRPTRILIHRAKAVWHHLKIQPQIPNTFKSHLPMELQL